MFLFLKDNLYKMDFLLDYNALCINNNIINAHKVAVAVALISIMVPCMANEIGFHAWTY